MSGNHATIVTGVSRGLGAAIVEALLDRGGVVLWIGRSSYVPLDREHYEFVRADPAAAADLDETLLPAMGRLRDRRLGSVCLVNHAASPEALGTVGRLSSSEIAAAMTVNLAAPIALMNLFLQVFGRDGVAQRIINVSSGAAVTPIPALAAYCAAKAGLEMAGATLAAEQPARDVAVVTIRPGVIDTDMQRHARAQSADLFPSLAMFKQFHEGGSLVPPGEIASKIVNRLVLGDVENGAIYSHDSL